MYWVRAFAGLFFAACGSASEPSVPPARQPQQSGDTCPTGGEQTGLSVIQEGCLCEPGAERDCYQGDPSVVGRGVCHAGRQRCDTAGEFGRWSACKGQVSPSAEVCGNDLDDNCNGMVDEGCAVCTTPVVYASTMSELYRVDPNTFATTLVGAYKFLPADRHNHEMTDIAVDASGQIWGTTYNALYRIDSNTAECSFVVPLGGGLQATMQFNALSFLSGAQQRLVAATADGRVYEINIATGATSLLGSYGPGLQSAGDIVSIQGAGTFAVVTFVGNSTERLVRLDETTGEATVIGPTGTKGCWGLGYWGGILYGFTTGGGISRIDPMTGAMSTMSGTGHAWWGAGSTTCASTR